MLARLERVDGHVVRVDRTARGVRIVLLGAVGGDREVMCPIDGAFLHIGVEHLAELGRVLRREAAKRRRV